MIPVKLNLSNFTSYGENVPELDFTKFHMAAISGQNGAGKSSLLDSITWCVWGVSRLGDSSDQLLRLGQGVMWVEFSFELDKHIFTIRRQRILKGGGSTALEFLSNKHNLTEGTIKATQQKIVDTLHLTYETFTNSAYLRQGHADEFTTKGPSERKKILADILGLSHYDLLEEKAKEKIKEIQNKLVGLEYTLLEIEAELSQKEERTNKKKAAEEKVLELEKQIKILDAALKILRQEKETLNLASEERKKLEQNYLQNKKELDEIALSGKSRKGVIENLKKELQSLDGIEEKLQELKILQEEKENLGKIQQKKLETEKNISEIKGLISLKKQQQENLNKEIVKLKLQIKETEKSGAKCPACLQEIGKVEKAHVHEELKKQIETLEKELQKIDFFTEEKTYQDLENTLKSFSFDPEKYLKLTQKLLNLEKLQQQKEKMIQLQATLQTEEKVVLEMRILFQNKKILVDKLAIEIEKLPDLSAKLNLAVQDVLDAEAKLENLRTQEKEAQGTLGQMKELISRTAQFEKNKTEQTEKKITLQKEKGIYEELAQAFGKKGIQAMIIETAIPEIEEETSRLLDKLSDGRMKVTLETQRETKSKVAGTGEKGMVETLDIIIADEMGQRPYETYSGGEQFRVNFSIRLALSKLLTHRAGAKLQFLVIDEGFGTQDAQGRGRIVEALNAIKDEFEKILIITHLEELKEEFPARIEVSKGPIGSTFEVVGV